MNYLHHFIFFFFHINKFDRNEDAKNVDYVDIIEWERKTG